VTRNMSRKPRPLAALAMVALIGAGCSNGSAENGNTGNGSSGNKNTTNRDNRGIANGMSRKWISIERPPCARALAVSVVSSPRRALRPGR